MVGCDFCENGTEYPFHCRYCGGYFCADHRLPPAHHCTGETVWQNTPSPHSVDFTRLKNGHVKISPGKNRGGIYTPATKDASVRSHTSPIQKKYKTSWKSIDSKKIMTVIVIILVVVLILLLIR